MAITFDKMAYTDKLRAAGFAEEQARAMAEGLDQALREQVATKADVDALNATLGARITRVEWMVGTNITLTILVLGKLLLLP